jgi:hypothetical protein
MSLELELLFVLLGRIRLQECNATVLTPLLTCQAISGTVSCVKVLLLRSKWHSFTCKPG